MPDTFDPDKYLASDDFDPEEYLKQTNPPTMSPADAAVSKVSQGITLGYGDEILGGLEGAYAKATGDTRPFTDIYREKRNVHRLRSAQADHDYPIGAKAADIGSAAAMTFTPVGKALTASKNIGAGLNFLKSAVIGGITAGGGSNADLTKGPGELSKLGEDVGKGAALGVGAQALATPVSYVAGKFSPGVLSQNAEQRAVKATIGQNKAAFTRMQQDGSLQKTGRDLLSDEAGGPAVGWFSNAEDILPKVQAKKQYYGKAIGDVGKEVDSIVGNSVQSNSIAAELEQELKKIPPLPKNAGVRNALEKEIEYYRTKGPMSFEEAQAHKGQYVFKPTDSTTQTLGQDVTNKARGAVSRGMETTADALANAEATSPEAKAKLDLYKRLKSKYGSFANAEKYGEKKVMGDLSNRFVSPSDYGAAAATGIASAAAGNPLPAVQAGIAGVANKQLRERGSAFAARTMDKLSSIIAADPAGLNRFRGALEKAASEGPQSLMLTHALLAEDPAYREVIENYKAGEKK